MHDADVVIVGAGIAGCALATTLARQGVSVLLLEKILQHVDRIRGERLAPWGVAPAAKIGVLSEVLAAGVHYITRSMRYSENVPTEEGRANVFDLGALFPSVLGAMGAGHPQIV
jgi:menaquinone-9 beta-reductase